MTAIEDFDVIVVGAGPAGCAAAAAVLAERPGASLLMVDRADFPRDKSCGDGIAHEVDEVLADLGFDTEAVFDGCPPVDRLAVTSPRGVEVRRQMRSQVHVVPREVFDARLVADLRARGVQLRRHQVRTLTTSPAGVTLDGVLRARVVIGADGAESVVRRQLGVPATPDKRVALAIRGYAAQLPGQDGTQVITMTDRHWPAYAWSFPLGDGRANVGYGQLLGDGPLRRGEMLGRLTDLLPGLDGPIEKLRAHRLPLSSGRPRIPDGPVVLVGDAQSLINPFTGEGIFYAVVSGSLAGRAAANALSGGDAGGTYRRLLAQRLGRHLRHTSALSLLGGWSPLVDAGVRAATADQGAFDDLVRFGLSDGLLTGRLVRRLRFRD